jgi:hypothetical protein
MSESHELKSAVFYSHQDFDIMRKLALQSLRSIPKSELLRIIPQSRSPCPRFPSKYRNSGNAWPRGAESVDGA